MNRFVTPLATALIAFLAACPAARAQGKGFKGNLGRVNTMPQIQPRSFNTWTTPVSPGVAYNPSGGFYVSQNPYNNSGYNLAQNFGYDPFGYNGYNGWNGPAVNYQLYNTPFGGYQSTNVGYNGWTSSTSRQWGYDASGIPGYNQTTTVTNPFGFTTQQTQGKNPFGSYGFNNYGFNNNAGFNTYGWRAWGN